jgi:two-component system chemotaxis response regulator CheY
MMEDIGRFTDLLDLLEEDVLRVDRDGDTSIVHLLFRNVHNLKGGIAQADLPELVKDFHHLEDGLDRMRRGKEPWGPEWSDAILKVIDKARHTFAHSADAPGPVPVAPPIPAPRLEPVGPFTWKLPLAGPQANAVAEAMDQGLGIYRIEKLFRLGLSREAFEGLPIMEDVAEVGTLIAVAPLWEEYARGPEDQVVRFLFSSSQTLEELGNLFFDPLIEVKPPVALKPQLDRSGRLRILVVEDDGPTGELLKYILKQHGHCARAKGGMEALEMFNAAWRQGQPFHLIVLDLHMPDMHGNTLLEKVRTYESEHGIRGIARSVVIVNTASRDLEEMKTSVLLEADAYLIKPVTIEAIQDKIEGLKARLAEAEDYNP